MRKILSTVPMLLCVALWLYSSVANATGYGVFSVSATTTVEFAAENYTSGDAELLQWENIPTPADAGDWRVLTGAEWSYLLASGRDNAAALNALGCVNGQNGLIILPDGWVAPDGISYRPVTEGIGYTMNPYTTEEWAIMAASGAVFLPSKGYGYKDNQSQYKVEDIGTRGSYWSADSKDGSNAYACRFSDSGGGEIHDFNAADKERYYCIRRVRNVATISENDEQSIFVTKIAAAKEWNSSKACIQRTLWRDGYYNTLCLPFSVADIESSPLAGAEVYAFTSGQIENDMLVLEITRVNSIEHGVPYLIRWEEPGSTLTYMEFSDITWDNDNTPGDDTGDAEGAKFHGFYYKTHLSDATNGAGDHYNFFVGDADEIYWPTDGNDASAKMKGFRAHFYILPNGTTSNAPLRRGIPAILRIIQAEQTATTVELLHNDQHSGDGSKQLQEGRVVLIINGVSYSIGGQRL